MDYSACNLDRTGPIRVSEGEMSETKPMYWQFWLLLLIPLIWIIEHFWRKG